MHSVICIAFMHLMLTTTTIIVSEGNLLLPPCAKDVMFPVALVEGSDEVKGRSD